MTDKEISIAGKRVFASFELPLAAAEYLRAFGIVIDEWHDMRHLLPRDYLLNAVKDVEGFICIPTNKVDDELLDHAKNLKVISTYSVGLDHINIPAVLSRGILLGNTPGLLADTVAELAIALLLCVARQLSEAMNVVRSGRDGKLRDFFMCGRDVRGSTVGIVGLGSIGQSLAGKLSGFQVNRILYSGPTDKKVDYATYVTLEDLVANSDYVVITCALNESTKGLFDMRLFKLMKKSGCLINVSRGAVVNQEDLYEALTGGVIASAGLDVTTPEPFPTDHPLLSLPNCVVLPHIGSATVGTRTDMVLLMARNLVNGLSGRPMETPVLQ